MTSIKNIELGILNINPLGKVIIPNPVQARDQKAGENLSDNKIFAPDMINDTVDLVSKSRLIFPIKDTTGAILEKMKAQLEAGIRGTEPLDPAAANAKSFQIGTELTRQPDKNLVQTRFDFLRFLIG
ncbi:MAG: hypothetical protein HY200_03825 [Nitrospirae bacterium]|nr:hypothetical protein [Nitrospirota bacterium]